MERLKHIKKENNINLKRIMRNVNINEKNFHFEVIIEKFTSNESFFDYM